MGGRQPALREKFMMPVGSFDGVVVYLFIERVDPLWDSSQRLLGGALVMTHMSFSSFFFFF
jgi:hypothetical protein